MIKPFFFCKQKTAYEMRISDWSSDVCSSDLTTTVDRIVTLDGDLGGAVAGQSVTLTLSDEVDCSRGDVIAAADAPPEAAAQQIGRASCRERVCQYVWISGVAGSLKKQTMKPQQCMNYQHNSYNINSIL